MLIDWFTVGAQALNFIILVLLMKHFLYRPILHAIDVREKGIATKLTDAEAKRVEADRERSEYQRKNEEFQQQRAELLSQATNEANSERQRIVEGARQAADALSVQRQQRLRNEVHEISQSIRRRMGEEIFSVARKLLVDLATASLEECMSEAFTRRLREMDGQAKANLSEALKSAANPALVRSAFELPNPQRAMIQKCLDETFSSEFPILFEAAPDLICGIELCANGQKVAWSVDDYLESLELSVETLLGKQDEPGNAHVSEALPVPSGAANVGA